MSSTNNRFYASEAIIAYAISSNDLNCRLTRADILLRLKGICRGCKALVSQDPRATTITAPIVAKRLELASIESEYEALAAKYTHEMDAGWKIQERYFDTTNKPDADETMIDRIKAEWLIWKAMSDDDFFRIRQMNKSRTVLEKALRMQTKIVILETRDFWNYIA